MTARALLHHVFPWEIAPGIARGEDPEDETESPQDPPVPPQPAA